MRKLLLCLVLCVYANLSAQESQSHQEDLPNITRNISIGFGVGPSYGIMGAKVLIGSDNSGLSLGVGSLLGSVPCMSFGGQLGLSKETYISFNYGSAMVVQVNNEPAEALTGAWLLFGVKLADSKKVNLDFSLGHTFSVEKTEYFGISESNDGITFNLGLNFKIL